MLVLESQAIRSISRLLVPVVEAQAKKIVATSSSPVSAFISSIGHSYRNAHVASKSLSTVALRKYSSKVPGALETGDKVRDFPSRLYQATCDTLRKVFPPMNSSTSHRVISGLNRFGPLQSINPMFMFNLQSTFRPYVTISVSLLTSLLWFSSLYGTPDSTMRLAAVPVRFWSGEETRILSSPLLHTHAIHLLTASGFFLAFSTVIEVAAGPVALLAILLSTAVVGAATAIATPERSANLYLEKIQMGLWPTVLGLASFFWMGIRNSSHSYLMKNPNLSVNEKLFARQLSVQLSQRRVPLALMASLAILPLPGIDSTAMGGLAGGLVGGLLGYMWTRSPHLVLINAAAAAAGALYLAQNPVWTLKFRAFKFSRAWEDGEFLRAREWLHLFEHKAITLSPDQQQWTHITMALVEMACGRTSVALSHAQAVDIDSIVLKRDLQHLKDKFTTEWKAESAKQETKPRTNLTPEGIQSLIDPARLASLQAYQSALKAAPWRTMNDEQILALFYATFIADAQRTPQEMQNLILDNYKGLFEFDPTYQCGTLEKGNKTLRLPSHVTDNPLQ